MQLKFASVFLFFLVFGFVSTATASNYEDLQESGVKSELEEVLSAYIHPDDFVRYGIHKLGLESLNFTRTFFQECLLYGTFFCGRFANYIELLVSQGIESEFIKTLREVLRFIKSGSHRNFSQALEELEKVLEIHKLSVRNAVTEFLTRCDGTISSNWATSSSQETSVLPNALTCPFKFPVDRWINCKKCDKKSKLPEISALKCNLRLYGGNYLEQIHKHFPLQTSALEESEIRSCKIPEGFSIDSSSSKPPEILNLCFDHDKGSQPMASRILTEFFVVGVRFHLSFFIIQVGKLFCLAFCYKGQWYLLCKGKLWKLNFYTFPGMIKYLVFACYTR